MTKYNFNTTPERSLLMSKIRAKNTKPEIKLRKALWAIGLRYRIHDKKLPGTPDIVLKKYKLAIFVDGEFWHGKDWEIKKKKISTNRDYWIPKIENNMMKDKLATEKLQLMGFTVFRCWSTELNANIGITVKSILDSIEAKEYL